MLYLKILFFSLNGNTLCAGKSTATTLRQNKGIQNTLKGEVYNLECSLSGLLINKPIENSDNIFEVSYLSFLELIFTLFERFSLLIVSTNWALSF